MSGQLRFCSGLLFVVLRLTLPCPADEWAIYCHGELARPYPGLGTPFNREFVVPEHGLYQIYSVDSIEQVARLPQNEKDAFRSLGDTIGVYSMYATLSSPVEEEKQRHIEAWCLAVDDGPGHPSSMWPDLVFDGNSANVFGHLTKLPHLRHVELYTLSPEETRFAEVAKLAKLEYLGLPQNATDEHLEHVARLKKLKFLNASGTKITGKGLAGLARLSCLRTLDLRGVELGPGGLSALCPSAPVETLLLAYTDTTDEDLRHLLNLPTLRYVSLHHTDISDEGIKYLARIPNLHYVSLYKTRASPITHDELLRRHSCLRVNLAEPRTLIDFLSERHLVHALAGNLEAQLQLARVYTQTGPGRPTDLIQALKWCYVLANRKHELPDLRSKKLLEQTANIEKQLGKNEAWEAKRRAQAFIYLYQRSRLSFVIEREEGLPLYQYGFEVVH